MRKLYLLLGIVALLASCTGGKNDKPLNAEFTLNGKLPDNQLDGKEIYLLKFDSNSDNYTPVDTAIVTNDTFTFKETLDGTSDMRFVSTYGFSKSVFVVAEQGEIEIAIDSTLTSTTKGGELNTKYQEYIDKKNSFSEQMQDVKKLAAKANEENKLTPEYEKELEGKYNSTYEGLRAYIFAFTKENISNTAGQYALIDRAMSFDKAQLEELVGGLDEGKRKEAKFHRTTKRLATLKATDVGNPFIDVKSNTPDGKPVALSDYAGKGKYVLVDFWASWCPPCREDMPAVVDLYKKYKAKGFEIVGVSLDNDNNAWKKGIKDMNITWPQMSDLKGWQTEAGSLYAVTSIPHMVLLDKEGKIIANKITVPELSKKLEELLK